MRIPTVRLVQLAVQLRDSPRRRDSVGDLPVQRVSASRSDHLAQLLATTSGALMALGGVTEMTTAEVRSIAVRIEARLQSIAEHEAAIRMDLEALASLSSPAADDHLLDIAAAAQWLGVSRATMFRLLRLDNQLRHVKVGKRTLFRPDDLRSYAARQVASGPGPLMAGPRSTGTPLGPGTDGSPWAATRTAGRCGGTCAVVPEAP